MHSTTKKKIAKIPLDQMLSQLARFSASLEQYLNSPPSLIEAFLIKWLSRRAKPLNS